LRHPECTRSSIGTAPFNNAFSDASTIAFTNTSLTYQPRTINRSLSRRSLSLGTSGSRQNRFLIAEW
jgi:hypothetical protein